MLNSIGKYREPGPDKHKLLAYVDSLSLRNRIFVLCWASIGVACAVAAALSILSQGAKLDEQRLRDLGSAHDTASTLEKDFTSLTRDMYRMVASPTATHIEAARGNLQDFKRDARASHGLLSAGRYHDVDVTIQGGIREFETLFEELENDHPNNAATISLYTDRISTLDDAIDAAIERVRDATASDQQALFARLDKTKHQGLFATLGAVLAAALLMLALSVFIGRSIRTSVSRIEAALSALARGEREVDATGEGRNDEFGALARAVQAFRRSLIEGDRLRSDAERTAEEERVLSSALTAALAELERERASLEGRVLSRTHDLEAETRRAEEASMAKSRFIANMSHELRTPLNAIIGYSEIMREYADDEARQRDLSDHDRVLRAARDLLKMINEILDLSKIEAGKMDVDANDLDVPNLLRGAIDAVRPQAAANNNTIAVEIDRDGFGAARGDAFKLHQCLVNLLANAAKFTKDGVIIIRARREDDDLRFEIQDSGIGIPTEKIAELFQPFVQADGSTTRSFGGTGLGLAITRNLAQLLGGDVSVDSAVGAGSTFRLTVPANMAASPVRAAISNLADQGSDSPVKMLAAR